MAPADRPSQPPPVGPEGLAPAAVPTAGNAKIGARCLPLPARNAGRGAPFPVQRLARRSVMTSPTMTERKAAAASAGRGLTSKQAKGKVPLNPRLKRGEVPPPLH